MTVSFCSLVGEITKRPPRLEEDNRSNWLFPSHIDTPGVCHPNVLVATQGPDKGQGFFTTLSVIVHVLLEDALGAGLLESI